MENPLELPAPEDPIQRIVTLARDLAYGAIIGAWGSKISVSYSSDGAEWVNFEGSDSEDDISFNGYLVEKWENQPPSADLMHSFGYFLPVGGEGNFQTDYLLTEKAFALLEKPITPPKVFISYRQIESSALGLLIEARLKLVDNTINVFIDKLIEPSQSLDARIQKAIEDCEYFICLLGLTTLAESTAVKDEIALAIKLERAIFPICHNRYTVDDNYRAIFHDIKAQVIQPESAEEYELAMIRLLNGMGYSNV